MNFSIHLGHRRLATAVAFLIATAVVAFTVGASQPAAAAYPGGNGWITYEQGKDIWVISADGSAGPFNLTNSGSLEADPTFSADGTQIAYSSTYGSSGGNIWIGDFDAAPTPSLTDTVQVTTGGSDGEPTWSPDGSTIAFERRIAASSSGTATADDPTGLALTDSAATFMTDGVATGMTITNTAAMWTGTVSSAPATETALAITPDSPPVVWTTGDGYEISSTRLVVFKVGATGVGETQLSDSGPPFRDDGSPVWSPNNDKIAFVSDRLVGLNDNNNVYIMDTDGTDQTSITDDFYYDFDNHANRPAWSPDGTRIAFHARPGAHVTKSRAPARAIRRARRCFGYWRFKPRAGACSVF